MKIPEYKGGLCMKRCKGPRRTGVTFLERKVTKGTFAETPFPFWGRHDILKHAE